MTRRRISKAQYNRRLPGLRDQLLDAQSQLRKAQTFALAVIVTGMPAAGRSESVNTLLEWLDPKYVTVHAFDAPDREDLQRPPMWRYWRTLPARGRIAFYFGGWYSGYLSAAIEASRKAREDTDRMLARIRQLEKMLVADGIRVVKLHLHIDGKTQRERLVRLRSGELTRWRVTQEDLWLAKHYQRVNRAVERCLKASNHRAAPWHSIDGTDEEYRLLKVAGILRDELREGLRALPEKGKFTWPEETSPKSASVHAKSPATKFAKEEYERELELLQGRLALLVRRSPFRKHALVLAFEGMDAAGKGGAIRRITQALDARQYQVVPVSAPAPEELGYPYLWRFWREVPECGAITIFDRSWYGRVLVERVRGLTPEADWRRAYDEIAEFERQLVEHGAIVAKLWLDVSKEEQLKRFKARDENPLKRFKVDPEDWENRRHFEAYQAAAAETIERTHADDAKWTVVQADDKKAARLTVLRAVCGEIERRLDLQSRSH